MKAMYYVCYPEDNAPEEIVHQAVTQVVVRNRRAQSVPDVFPQAFEGDDR